MTSLTSESLPEEVKDKYEVPFWVGFEYDILKAVIKDDTLNQADVEYLGTVFQTLHKRAEEEHIDFLCEISKMEGLDVDDCKKE